MDVPPMGSLLMYYGRVKRFLAACAIGSLGLVFFTAFLWVRSRTTADWIVFGHVAAQGVTTPNHDGFEVEVASESGRLGLSIFRLHNPIAARNHRRWILRMRSLDGPGGFIWMPAARITGRSPWGWEARLKLPHPFVMVSLLVVPLFWLKRHQRQMKQNAL